MIDITYCRPQIHNLVCSIYKRIKELQKQQAYRTFVDGIPDEAIEIELDKLIDVLKMYKKLGLLEFSTIKPGRW